MKSAQFFDCASVLLVQSGTESGEPILTTSESNQAVSLAT